MATRTVKLADVRTATHEHRDKDNQIVKTQRTELTFHGVDAHGRIRTRLEITVEEDDSLLVLDIGDEATLDVSVIVATPPTPEPTPTPAVETPAAAPGLTPTPPPAEQPSAPLPSAQPSGDVPAADATEHSEA